MERLTAPGDTPSARAAGFTAPQRAAMRNVIACCSVKGSFSSCGRMPGSTSVAGAFFKLAGPTPAAAHSRAWARCL